MAEQTPQGQTALTVDANGDKIIDPHGLSLPHLVAAIITAVIGGGVFTMAGDMAASGAGTAAVLIGWVVAGLGVFCLLMCFYGFAKFKPELTGGIYAFPNYGFGKYFGFNSIYGYWISLIMTLVSYTTLMMAAFAYFFPVFGEGNNLPSVIAASVVVWVCWFLITRGVREAASVNIVTTIAKIVPLYVAIVAMMLSASFDPDIFMYNFWGEDTGMSLFDQVSAMVSVTIWVFIGVETAVTISGRSKYAKNVGRSTIIAFVGILITYLLVSILSMGVMPRSELAELSNPSMAGVLEACVGPWGAALINIGVALSLFGAMLGYTIISAECPNEAARMGVFPTSFARRNSHDAPIVTATVTACLVQLFLIVLLVSEQTYQFFYGVAVNTVLVPYFLCTLCFAIVAFRRDGMEDVSGGKLAFYRIVGVLGTAYSLFLVYSSGLEGLMITTILFAPGILLYVKGVHDRNEQVLPYTRDKVLAAVIVVFFVVSIVAIATGTISVI
jgi:arginine:ornithine antiporter/lysine permease